MAQNIIISVKNLTKSFGDHCVLDGVNIEVKKEESLVILGGSGSGKSVLIKTMIGLLQPDSGSIKINDTEISKLTLKERNKIMNEIGFLFQGGALFDSLKIWENISFALINNFGATRKQAYEHALKKLESVGLEANVADLYPSELSGGMQKRASLARTISMDPKIIFFDEPTTGLDPIMANVINNLIKKCSKELKATTITITHDMSSAKIIGDKAAMLKDGKIIWEGNLKKIEPTADEYVKNFVKGIDKANIISFI